MTAPTRVPRAMVVAGVMSGTSADGVDVAVCRISPGPGEGATPRVRLLGHVGSPYPRAVRAAVLRVMEGEPVTAAEMSRLHWRLGEIYAECVTKACAELGVKTSAVAPSRDAHLSRGEAAAKMGHPVLHSGASLRLGLVACHGQTVYHQSEAARYLGAPVRATWQMGETSVIAERLRVPVVSDLRPADLAAGGQGAPLVPMLDYVMFRSERVSRVLQNLGGIGNLTAIPAGAGVDSVMAFDTGPANMIIDECMRRLYGRAFDRGGAVARSGQVLGDVVARGLREAYFAAAPPKSCGREQFGSSFTDGFIALCRKAGAADADVVATAAALTVESVLEGYRRFAWPHLEQAAPLAKTEFVVAGGGAKNAALMGMLRDGLEPLGVKVRLMEELGVPAQAKEAVAFALLGWLTWHGLPGNVPAATGARRAVVLGKVTL
ncbi:MAG TPA: anhydro-N-acetylmuramic acid kinase [Granulicella sp.]|jgi:anhydro-N-acetylmuramic acid kinase|nr:anhydro-N-acetylmuramic acid kinase [Granulicella sp.]